MGSVDSKKLMQDLEKLARTGHVAPEFVLATNILSVGIDIDRLSLMVVAGQPKTVSEYIQSTSRVGRTYPGMAIVAFNWSRARDRSHYEKFRSFHEQLYRFVEGISVTPTSPEARRRTLAGTIVAVARNCVQNLRSDGDTLNFNKTDRTMLDFKKFYLSFISDDDERQDTGREFDRIFDLWHANAQNKSSEMPYRAGAKGRGVLGVLGERRDNCIENFVMSLRNVDEEVPVQIARRVYV
jgi:superfamily II DNA/RNA helicase